MSAAVEEAPEHPAETIERAAAKVRKLGNAATPGPWTRAMKTRTKSAIVAPTPADAEFWQAGRPEVGICAVPTMGPSGFLRKRSGRDLDWMALAGPQIADALAHVLHRAAVSFRATDEANAAVPGANLDYERSAYAGLDLARVLLGEDPS